jgi:uncharacterized NAD(P)/FAD-binding protein YdhS
MNGRGGEVAGLGSIQVCVIGAGPRGISVVERLCANASAMRTRSKVVIHLVDPGIHNGGQVWSTAQPGSLLMNTISSQITMFTDDSVDCVGPVVPGPSLYEWARRFALTAAPGQGPDHVLREARELGPNSYPTRAFYGRYLSWVLRRLVRTTPRNVTLRLRSGRVVALADDEGGRQVVTLEDGSRLTELAAVVLAQGHLEMPMTPHESRLAGFAEANALFYQGPANPADVDLSRVEPGERLALRGMGLSFFDYLALLTHDRGGSFTPQDGRLVYHPSGREPVLCAGSRRGVPYHARGENQKGVFGRHDPLYLTEDVISALRARARDGRPADFLADIWPLISREVEAVYYTTLIAQRAGADVARAFQRRFVGGDPSLDQELLADFGVGKSDLWCWSLVAHPYGRRTFTDGMEFQSWLLDYLRRDVDHALRGNVRNPLKAALDVLRDLRNEVRLVVDHGGLTGSSYRDQLQDWYTPLNAFLSIGPPVRRVQEMIALMEAGVLRVIGPGMRIAPASDGTGFLVWSAGITGAPVPVDAVVEARLPEVDVRRTTDPLLRHLLRSGQAQPYRIPDGRHGYYETGGLAVTERPQHLIDAAGTAHPRRFAFGVPTEAVHWATAVGIRPGVNSVILGDADAIARAALTADQRVTPEMLDFSRAGDPSPGRTVKDPSHGVAEWIHQDETNHGDPATPSPTSTSSSTMTTHGPLMAGTVFR